MLPSEPWYRETTSRVSQPLPELHSGLDAAALDAAATHRWKNEGQTTRTTPRDAEKQTRQRARRSATVRPTTARAASAPLPWRGTSSRD